MTPEVSTIDSPLARSTVRMCAGCRGHAERDALVRFVRSDVPARLVPDLRRRLPGRGVSVHPTRRCIEAACRKGGFARGFRAPIRVEAEALIETLRAHYVARIDSLLLAARRRGDLEMGTEAVRRGLGRRKGDLLVVASDAANRRAELTEGAGRLGNRCLVHGDRSSLGRLFGRAPTGVVLVTDRRIAEAVALAAASLHGLLEER